MASSLLEKTLLIHWSSEQLLAAAMTKLKDFNQDMENGEYVLLCPDGSQIKCSWE